MLIALVIAILATGALVTLTMVGQRRRTPGLARMVLAGLFFPVAWTVWYLRDEHPYRTARRV